MRAARSLAVADLLGDVAREARVDHPILSDITTTVALSAEDTVKAFGQAGELAKKFRSAGADYYGVPVESTCEIAT